MEPVQMIQLLLCGITMIAAVYFGKKKQDRSERRKMALLESEADLMPPEPLFQAPRDDELEIFKKSLGGLTREEEIAALENAVRHHSNKNVQAYAFETLGHYKYWKILSRLENLITEADDNLAASIASTLGNIGDPQSEPMLLTLLERENMYVKIMAAQALARVGTATAVESLRKAAQSGDPDLIGAAEAAIDSIQGRAIGADIGQLSMAAHLENEGALSMSGYDQGALSFDVIKSADEEGALSGVDLDTLDEETVNRLALIGILLKVAFADDVFHENEKGYMENVCKSFEFQEATSTVDLYRRVVRTEADFDLLLRRVTDDSMRRFAIRHAIGIMISDGLILQSEKDIIERICRIWDMDMEKELQNVGLSSSHPVE
jgi:tellurite resistance protein